jgi:hypothetical protein
MINLQDAKSALGRGKCYPISCSRFGVWLFSVIFLLACARFPFTPQVIFCLGLSVSSFLVLTTRSV